MAATPGIINATDFKIYIDTTVGGSRSVAHSTSVSFQVQTDMMDATNKDSAGWDESIPGKQSWNANGDFYYDQSPEGTTNGVVQLWNAWAAKSKVKVRFRLGVMNTGDHYYEGDAFIESLDVSAGVEENVSYTISLKGTGPIQRIAQGAG
jgi:predicted secreted protein